jgi:hypothetical protein
MKKIIIASIAIFSVVGFYSCKKKNEVVSKVVTATYPTILIDGSEFYSIKLGGALPTIVASAYDSLLKENCAISLDASGLDNSVAGLNVLAIKAKNSLGYSSSRNVVVAVTDIQDGWNLTGLYRRQSNSCPVNVLEVANGLYEVDNVGGAPTFAIKGYFLHVNDSTITFPKQPTDAGTMDCINEKLLTLPADTQYSWTVVNPSFGSANRVFIKQP